MATKKESHKNKQEARERLLSLLKPGDVVSTSLKHVSRSGMMRHISCYVCRDNSILDISWAVCTALDYRRADNGGIKVSGCGMDMGFHLVYNLSWLLFPDGFTDKDGKFIKDGGYALTHRWI